MEASSFFSTGASSIRAVWMMASPETPSGSETTGPTCSATRSWILTGSSASRLCAASAWAIRPDSGSTSRLVGVRGGTMMSTPSPRSSR